MDPLDLLVGVDPINPATAESRCQGQGHLVLRSPCKRSAQRGGSNYSINGVFPINLHVRVDPIDLALKGVDPKHQV